MKKYSDWVPGFIHHLPEIGVALAAMLLVFAVLKLALRLWDWRQLLRQEYVCIEITPPVTADKTPMEVVEWLAILHGAGLSRTIEENLPRKGFTVSLEQPSTMKEGVRYVVRAPKQEVDVLKQAISAHLSNARIRIVDDYLPQNMHYKSARVLDFRLTGAYYLPLKTHDSFRAHDPEAYLTNALTGLKDNEHVVFQTILKPTVIKDAAVIQERIKQNEDMLARARSYSGGAPLKLIFGLLLKLISEIMYLGSDLLHASSQGSSPADSQRVHEHQVSKGLKPARSINGPEQAVNRTIDAKVRELLFRTEVRVLVITGDKGRYKTRAKSLRATIAAFKTEHQSLRARYNFPAFVKNQYRLFQFKHRLPALFLHNANILSASEIAGLYHFPAPGTNTESLVQSMSRTLPATLSLKRGTDIDVVIGRNHHQGNYTDIGLSVAERARHMYVVGATGNGKTTMMLYAIIQDIKNGKGVALIDPHGDLARDLLQFIPEERLNDVIYFDPNDLEYSIALNLLEIAPEIQGDDLLRAQYLITEYTVEIFRKLFSDTDSGGSRIEAVLRNAIYTAFTTKDPTLFTIYRLITDRDYRREVVERLDDEVLKNFWNNEFDQGGAYQRVKMGFGVTTKVGRFLTAVFVRRVMDQPKSTIDFDDIINNGKILICNFSKGALVKDTSTLFGTAVLARLQIAAQRRGHLREHERRPFYVYVDEFQNFATTTFVDMLAEARKYKVHLFMAEQSTSQQDKEVIYNILANVGTVVCFSTGNPMDERLLLPLFQPPITAGEIANLPSYNFFTRIKPIGASDSQMPVSGETIKLDIRYDKAKEDRVIAASRANYAKKYEPEKPKKDAEDGESGQKGTVSNPTIESR